MMSLGVYFQFVAVAGALSPGRHSLRYVDQTYANEYGAVLVKAVYESGVSAVESPAAQRAGRAPVDDAAYIPEDDDAIDMGEAYAPPPQQRELTISFEVARGAAGAASGAEDSVGGPTAPKATSEATASLPPPDRPEQPGGSGYRRRGAERTEAAKSRLRGLLAAERRGPVFWLFALSVSALLGALHALEPGHGKSIVAAYLVGSRGTIRHAVVLGAVVTLTHTSSVIALGLVLLYLQEHVAPAAVGPAVTIISGLAIFAIGLLLLIARSQGGSHHHSHGHEHTHAHDHTHSHSNEPVPPHDHPHPHREHPHEAEVEAGRDAISMKTLVPLGISGGMVPCPPAIVALLFAFSMGRVAFGLAVILAFSVGLAVVLTAIGIAMVTLRDFAGRFSQTGPLLRALPIVSAIVVTCLGAGIVVRGLIQAGVLTFRISVASG